MGIRSLGPKLMWCKYGGGNEGHNLEMQFRHFKQTHCEDCEHHSPRGENWTCTMEDVQEQERPTNMYHEGACRHRVAVAIRKPVLEAASEYEHDSEPEVVTDGGTTVECPATREAAQEQNEIYWIWTSLV